MSEEKITLTFDPFPTAPTAPDASAVIEPQDAVQAQAEAALAQADAVMETAAPEEKKQEETQRQVYDDSMLTEEEKEMVRNFASQIDITNSAQVMQYGAGAQQKVAGFSEQALENVKTKDLGEVGGLISGVITELKGFDAEESKGFLGVFKKKANDLSGLKAKYAKAESNINTIIETLEKHQITLMKDSATLDQLYNLNLTYYKELTMYILAGKQKLQEIQDVTIPELRAKAAETGTPEDAQKVNDMVEMANRFDKKIHDLELTRTVSLQMAPQIRLVQNNDVMMSDKIQSTIVNTIPLWKSQMVIALGLAHSEAAVKAQREVSELTNDILRKNAEKLKTATIETAKESERGVVDMETLKYTNEQLITTLEEVTRIQDEGRQKRRDAEAEIQRMEDELKQKLLSMKP